MARAPKTAAAPAAAAPTASNYPVLKAKDVVAAVERYCEAKAAYELAKDVMEKAKPVIFEAMGDAPTAFCGARVLTRSVVSELPATENRAITKDMIGTVIPGRKGKAGYTMLRVQ